MTSERAHSPVGQPHKQLIEQILAQHFGRDCVVAQLTSRTCDYSSSHLLYELQVELSDGDPLKLIYKLIGPSGLSRLALNVRPEFLYSSCREAEVYGHVLTDVRLGTPMFYGLHADRGVPQALLLEHVAG